MGALAEISKRVDVELRRESFRLIVGTDEDYENTEYLYSDLDDMIEALQYVKEQKEKCNVR